MKRLCLLLVCLVLLPWLTLGQEDIKVLTDSILKDTAYVGDFYRKKMIELAERIQKDGNDKSKLFPFTPYHKVVAYQVLKEYHTGEDKDVSKLTNTALNKEKNRLIPTASKKGVTLTAKQTEQLLKIMNEPLSFYWDQCGTPIVMAAFVFYDRQEKIIACVDLSCGFRQVITYQENIRIKGGNLTDKTFEEIKTLCRNLGIYYKRL